MRQYNKSQRLNSKSLSPHQTSSSNLDDITFKQIYKIHQLSLRNTDRGNLVKVAICFAGVPGVGKTTISKLLETELKATRIEIDEIRKITQTIVDKDLELVFENDDEKYDMVKQRSYKYLHELINFFQGNSINSTLIFDFSLDRRYIEITDMLKRYGYNIKLISLEAKRNTILKRLEGRETELIQIYKNMLDGWIKSHNTFNHTFESDLSINTDGKLPISIVQEICLSIKQFTS